MLSTSEKYLEEAFDILNQVYFNSALPKVVITIQASPKCYGYITTRQIWTDAEKEESYYEINLSAEYLDRGYIEVCATLQHEMVHLYCMVNGIRDTSNGGRYHNKRFKQEAEARGLQIEYRQYIGYSITHATEEFISVLQANGLDWDILYSREVPQNQKGGGGSGGKSKGKSSTRKYQCPCCGLSVRATKKVYILCGACMCEMERV